MTAGTDKEDERQSVVELLDKLIQHLEPLLLNPPGPSTKQSQWLPRLDQLITEARQYQPKHPLMRRIGGHPNVFAPVKKGRVLMPQAYKVIRDSHTGAKGAKKGEIVFRCVFNDYGCAADDTAVHGHLHIAVTMKRSGGYPFFTIALRDLEETEVPPLEQLTDYHVEKVCKPGTDECCRYLTMTSMGWDCAKHTELAEVLDSRVERGEMKATGDNCDGRESKLASKPSET